MGSDSESIAAEERRAVPQARAAGGCDEGAMGLSGGAMGPAGSAMGPARGAGDDLLPRALLAELAGSALLVLLSCLPAAAGADPLHAALAAGAVVAMLVQCFDHISGAMFNPAVTLAAALSGRVRWGRAAAYVPAQLVGAAAGGGLLAAVGGTQACVAGMTLPGPGMSAGGAALLEAALAACLAWANTAHWDGAPTAGAPQPRESWPLRIGATVTALALVAGRLTGASMNPVRSLGPALCAAAFHQHWVYWAGPLSGAGGAALLYRALWRRRPPPRPPRAPRPRPRSKPPAV